jgi:hypothetical protein
VVVRLVRCLSRYIGKVAVQKFNIQQQTEW